MVELMSQVKLGQSLVFESSHALQNVMIVLITSGEKRKRDRQRETDRERDT